MAAGSSSAVQRLVPILGRVQMAAETGRGGWTAGPATSQDIKPWLRRAAFALYQSLARQGTAVLLSPNHLFQRLEPRLPGNYPQ
jgi:hypothetical protein